MATQGKKPLSLRIDPDLLRRVDEARGDVPRTRFIERALERAVPSRESPKGSLTPEEIRTEGLKATVPSSPPLSGKPIGLTQEQKDASSGKSPLDAPLNGPGIVSVKTEQTFATAEQRPFHCPRCPDWPGANTQATRCPQCRSRLVPRRG